MAQIMTDARRYPARFLMLSPALLLALPGCDTAGGPAERTSIVEPARPDSDAASEGGAEDVLSAAKLLIEHNATDEDTGFQAFTDGEPWRDLKISAADHGAIIDVQARGELRTLGLTELFFETNEPSNAEVPLEDILAVLPEGDYAFEARSVDGVKMFGSAALTHAIPKGPVILSPADGSVVDPNDLVIQWEAVTESITSAPVAIAGYQVIVERDTEPPPHSFAHPTMSIHVIPSVTSVTVPSEFLEPTTAYKFEVLAIEEGGNQTISSGTFTTG